MGNERLPDALEAAGCNNPVILTNFRQPDEHVPGENRFCFMTLSSLIQLRVSLKCWIR